MNECSGAKATKEWKGNKELLGKKQGSDKLQANVCSMVTCNFFVLPACVPERVLSFLLPFMVPDHVSRVIIRHTK